MKKEIIGKLIGSFVRIVEAGNKSLLNLEGKVIDETRNTIKIQTKNKLKTIIKNQVKIQIK